jgi:glutathione S-transferase
LNYIASEVHTSIGGLFYPNPEEVKTFIKNKANTKLTYLENDLIGDKEYIVGNQATVADYYLYIVLTWTNFLGIDLTPFPKVGAFVTRISNLPNVKAAHARMAENPATVL